MKKRSNVLKITVIGGSPRLWLPPKLALSYRKWFKKYHPRINRTMPSLKHQDRENAANLLDTMLRCSGEFIRHSYGACTNALGSSI
jgi:hypothetical protein